MSTMSNQETKTDPWHHIMELAQLYPSPHNGQPIKLKVIDNSHATVFFDTARGLFASELGYKFSYLTVGVFVEFFVRSADALGYQVSFEPLLTAVDSKRGPYLHNFGGLVINGGKQKSKTEAINLLKSRQTSRNSYSSEVPSDSLVGSLKKTASQGGQVLATTRDSEKVKKIMWLNQTTLFSDLQAGHMRQELDHWLRYTKHQARTKRDGLSAVCLRIPGWLMFLAVKQPWLVTNRLTNSFFRTMYMRTMRQVPSVAWLQGPFATYEDYITSGRTFMSVWLELTKQGYYLHPYGTIPTNPAILDKFAAVVGADQKSQGLVWMIFRFGKSAEPPRSYRLPLEQHFVEEQ